MFFFCLGVHGSVELADTGALLALRALGWGTLYAIGGTTCFCYGIWKLSGAKNLKEFRIKMGNFLPVIPKNNPPQSRTEFSGMNDLMKYLSEEYGNKKMQDVTEK
ncbi:jg20049 [Pararge aegeria aegeria]|uniref:Transmembrane protein 242 n=1 Tax=Pararge aegeria aegeria TaxID=348720 RepID=A0A8S4RAD8_9NEOP|nr:jg20049 [Pararge aegeria aegeria]